MKDEVSRVAGDILRAEGFVALTMDRIAREVGVSRGTLYNYFADADEVVAFVEKRAIEPLHDRIEAIGASDLVPEGKLQAIATTIFERLFADRALALALFCKHEPGARRSEHKIRLRNAMLATVRGIVAHATARGRFREVPPELAAECFLGAITAHVDTMLYAGELQPAEEIVPRIMDLLLAGLHPAASRVAPEPSPNPQGEPDAES